MEKRFLRNYHQVSICGESSLRDIARVKIPPQKQQALVYCGAAIRSIGPADFRDWAI
jgi:hypothetical protein